MSPVSISLTEPETVVEGPYQWQLVFQVGRPGDSRQKWWSLYSGHCQRKESSFRKQFRSTQQNPIESAAGSKQLWFQKKCVIAENNGSSFSIWSGVKDLVLQRTLGNPYLMLLGKRIILLLILRTIEHNKRPPKWPPKRNDLVKAKYSRLKTLLFNLETMMAAMIIVMTKAEFDGHDPTCFCDP